MTKMLTQKRFDYSVTVNIDNKIHKTYFFIKKSTAYYFLVHGIKPLVKMVALQKPSIVSACCFKHKDGTAYLLSRKNLTETYFQ